MNNLYQAGKKNAEVNTNYQYRQWSQNNASSS